MLLVLYEACTGLSNQPAASPGPAPAKHLSTGPLSDSSGIICLLIVKCALRLFAGWRAKLLQGSDPIHAAWATLKRKEILVFHTTHSACADFLFSLGQIARNNYCLTFMRKVALCPKKHWKAASNTAQLPSCCTLITGEHRLLRYNSIKQDWRQSYNRTVLKLSAAVVGFFALHVACKTLHKDAFSTYLLKEVGWVVFCKNSRNPKSLVLTLGQHNSICHHILIMFSNQNKFPKIHLTLKQ